MRAAGPGVKQDERKRNGGGRGCDRPRPPHRSRARQGVAAAGFEKSTVGGAFRIAGSVTSKYFRCLAPVTFAVSAVGNWRMYVLYCFTASL